MERSVRKTVLTLTAAFILSALLCAAVSIMVVSPVYYVPVISGTVTGPGDFLSAVGQASGGTLICAALIFLSGFSAFPRPILAAVALWRGVSLGFAVSSEYTGSLIFLRERNILGVPPQAALPLTFFLSAMISIFMSAYSASFSRAATSYGGLTPAGAVVKYTLVSLVFCGALILLDVLRIFMI